MKADYFREREKTNALLFQSLRGDFFFVIARSEATKQSHAIILVGLIGR